jgi:hypothetical protein
LGRGVYIHLEQWWNGTAEDYQGPQADVRASMSNDFKTGDRIRVRIPARGYQAGDKGTVLSESASAAGDDEKSYSVAMDKDGSTSTAIDFSVRDIELDE